jgi:CAAX protease family protein
VKNNMNSITNFIKRYQLAIFFTLSIATFYAGNLWKVKDPNSPWFLSIYGTGLSALLVVSLTEGWAGVKTWASRIIRWRASLIWYAVAFTIPLLLQLSGYGLNLALGVHSSIGAISNRLSLWLPQFIQVFLVIALGEETGFRGYALPKLMEKHSPLVATLILGVLHALWHVPLFITGDSWWVVLHVIGGAFLFTLIFMNTRGSVLFAMILHSANNAWSTVISGSFFGSYKDQHTMLVGFMFVVMTVVIIIFARTSLTHKPGEAGEMLAAERPALAG